ncbi:MAG: YfiR family protein [Gammaproteobacteria bacterium]
MRDRPFAKLIATIARLVCLLVVVVGTSQADDSLEYKIKAAYLYNFTKFITWPEKDSATFNLCIIRDDPFQNLLDSLENKTALDKPIRVFRYTDIGQAKDCHIIYIDRERLALSGPQTTGSLTVSSRPDFAESGGMIGFVLEDEKVKLHINLKALKQSGLGISAKLIEVATLIEGNGHD